MSHDEYNVIDVKSQHENSSFGEQNTFTQLIHHFRKQMGEFEGNVYGYLTIDLITANSKITRPMLFVSDIGDNTSQNDNSNLAVMTRGIEITFATPLNFENEYFRIDVGNRGESLQNHFLEFKYRLLQAFSTFGPSKHNKAVVSIKNFKYQGSRFVGIEGSTAYYSYNFTYQEKLNMKRFNPAYDDTDQMMINWSICLPCEKEEKHDIVQTL